MSKAKLHIIYLAIIAVLLVVLGIALDRPEKVVESVKHTTDTVTVIKRDTVEVIKPVVKTERVVEEKVIYQKDTVRVAIPISEYRFFEKDLYDITALGYDVSLSNIVVYPKTITTTITNTTEKEVVLRQWDLYLNLGIWRFNQEWIPNIGTTVKTPKNLIFGANIGYYNKGVMFGVDVGYKITHNK